MTDAERVSKIREVAHIVGIQPVINALTVEGWLNALADDIEKNSQEVIEDT